jgi:hypothetical protein|tara:strand:+ start:18359 stop:18685 length:327 start_codon:yes stop_codon:yes gene_type:complete
MSDDLQPIIIDFNECSNDTLNESFLKMFGFAVKSILKYMFNDSPIPVKIKGHPTQVKSFVNALAQEKRYLDSYKQFGLDDPRTLQDKSILTQSVRKFERATGLKWPFK